MEVLIGNVCEARNYAMFEGKKIYIYISNKLVRKGSERLVTS